MIGDWVVQIEDGTHAIHAEAIISKNGRLMVTWDGEVLELPPVWLLLGDLKSFERNGHSLLLSVHGLGLLGSFVLSMDGVEIPRGGEAPDIQARPARIEFIEERSVQVSEEIVGIDEYPLDNRFGDQEFIIEKEVSRESTNELFVDKIIHLGVTVGLDILSAINADIEAHVSRETGHTIGEKVTEKQTHTFKVGPKSSVLYEVVWKRKVRSGECLYLSSGNPVTVPFRFNYGLSCNLRSSELRS